MQENRVWGSYEVLYSNENCKVKILTVNPGCGISYQRHFKREELWMVKQGVANIKYSTSPGEAWKSVIIKVQPEETFFVGKGWWHQVWNEGNEDLKILEVQFGPECVEEDIERLELYGVQTQ